MHPLSTLAAATPTLIDDLREFYETGLLGWVLWGATGIVIHLASWFVFWLQIGRHNNLKRQSKTRRTIVVAVVFVVLVFVWLVLIPVEDDSVRKTIATVFAVGVTGLITLSSTTLAANFMAGLMLRQVGTFRVGDFVRVEDHFGRVTARGAFHIEIQTETRDLVTLPNAYLISRPLEVVRHSGTMVTCEVSLGYDIAHERVEEGLRRAVELAGLSDPHVLVLELNDFSVQYRVAGFLEKVESIVTTRSRLRQAVLCVMREERIEIVSPTFMKQRRMEEPVIPEVVQPAEEVQNGTSDSELEKLVFDKAEDARRLERVVEKLKEAREQRKKLTYESKSGGGDLDADELARQVKRNERLVEYLEDLEARLRDEQEE